MFTINKLHDGKEWMLVDIGVEPFSCTWTTSVQKAFTFTTFEHADNTLQRLYNSKGYSSLQDCYVGEVFVGG